MASTAIFPRHRRRISRGSVRTLISNKAFTNHVRRSYRSSHVAHHRVWLVAIPQMASNCPWSSRLFLGWGEGSINRRRPV